MESNNNLAGSIDEYISAFPDDVQKILQEVRAVIKSEAPDAKEMINYGMPTFQLHGNLVHFAAFKKHLGFYPTPSGIEAFQAELAPYVSAKGSVQFPLDQPIPYDLIRRITAYRVKETMATANTRGRKK
jgi:uncharacterized protein YdhG (YjbR/CyaY superfamily)